MKIILEIPEEFEDHFKTDRFEDSLHRLSADVHSVAGNYEKELADMLIEAFRNSDEMVEKKEENITLTFTKGATNGDVMKTVFPNFKYNEEWKATRHFDLVIDHTEVAGIAKSGWWNEPYKRSEDND